jgi:c-di-GMP-binding flagellar brake protein YcgR
MNVVERRRSVRIPLSHGEAAIVHDGGRDILARVVDFSATGALLGLLDIPGLTESESDCSERVQVSMKHDQSVFQVPARVVRATPGFLAVEFFDIGEASGKINEKIRSITSGGAFSAAN